MQMTAPLSWEDVYEYGAWLVDSDVVTKDHVSTVIQRLQDLDQLRQSTYCAAQEERCRKRIKLYEGAHSVGKAPPPRCGAYRDLATRHKAIADVWISCGARSGGFQSILPSRANSSIIRGWTRLPVSVSKRVRSESTEESLWVPTYVWNAAAQYFPVRQVDLDLICHQLKCRSHSFRRGLAIAIRIRLFYRGYQNDCDIPQEVLQRMADIFTWKSTANCACYWDGFNTYLLSQQELLQPPKQTVDYILDRVLYTSVASATTAVVTRP